MVQTQILQQNFSGGEQSDKIYGRSRLPAYQNGARRIENFLCETQGPGRYRTGTTAVNHTRLNQDAVLRKFEYNDEQAYQLEFTAGKLRFFKDRSVITETEIGISGITQANPAVVTSTGHGYSDGDEVFIDSVAGMTEVNNRSYLVANSTSNTYELTDIDGVDIDSSGYTAYSSGGVGKKIYEIDTPYTEPDDSLELQMTQDRNTARIAHGSYEPRKLTRTGHTSWTLELYTRTADPFLDKKTITGITQADPAIVTCTSHGYANGDKIIIENVTGMTEVNSGVYLVASQTTNNFEITDVLGNDIDSTGFTAHSGSTGYASLQSKLPKAVSFYESRSFWGGQGEAPDRFIGSRTPTDLGVTRYDDFTTGTDDDHAVQFAIADEKVNIIRWLAGTDRLLLAGTFGSEVKIQGDTSDRSITPTSISVRPVNKSGVSTVPPINESNAVLYVERNGLNLRSLEFDALSDAFVPRDLTLLADHITESGIKQIAWQSGRPDILWAVRNDGVLIGMTFNVNENIAAWHRHTTGGVGGKDKFLSVSTMPRPTQYDEVWVVTERVIDGQTRRYVEYFNDPVIHPKKVDFFTGVGNEVADEERWKRAMWESQKEYIHLDCSLTYDGSLVGTAASAAVTPGAVSGTSVTFTADNAVFTSGMVGREIHKKSILGVGYGRAKITSVTNGTTVVCQILQTFDSTDAMAAGNWYLTALTVGGLDHLEGREVGITVNGAEHPRKTVTGGSVTLDYEGAKVHVGIPYQGFLQPMNIDAALDSGTALTKPKNINRVEVLFQETLGAEVGTDLYDPTEISFVEMPLEVGNPPALFSGTKEVPHVDSWEEDKTFYIRQTKSLPCIVSYALVHVDIDNEW